MVQIVLIGIGAGIAAALLFVSPASNMAVGLLLFNLAPLPILIAGLGWSHWAALAASLFASLGVAMAVGNYQFVTFLLGIGLPAWWLSYLALLARPIATPAGNVLEWYPVGRLVTWVAVLSALIVIAALLMLGSSEESIRSELRQNFERMLRRSDVQVASLPDVSRRIDDFVTIAIPVAAITVTFINLLLLWLAGRIVRISNQLRRPWPDIASMVFPPQTPALLGLAAAGVLLGFVGQGLLGMLSGIFVASLVTAYAVLGCAVIHAITRGSNIRGLLLGTMYVAIGLVWPTLVLIALFGLADTAIDIRGRLAGRHGPPTIPT